MVEKAKADEPKVEEIHIDEFLKGAKADEILKVMFRHFHANVKNIEKATQANFERLLDDFKKLPISELK